jgi:hypothetical protein
MRHIALLLLLLISSYRLFADGYELSETVSPGTPDAHYCKSL